MHLVVGFICYKDSSLRYLKDFLPSLEAALDFLPQKERAVFAFDNSDESDTRNREAIEEYGRHNPGCCEYLRAAGNLGFGRAYNIMIRQAMRLDAKYFLIINPDTVLEKDAIKEMAARLDAKAELASVAPKIRRWDFVSNTKTKTIDSCGLVLGSGLSFSDLGQGQEDDKRFDRAKILGPSGACGLFRLSDLESIRQDGQYFDENFFMYKEDCDLAYRLMKAGKFSELVPSAIVYHDRTAATTGDSIISRARSRRNRSKLIRTWSFRNQHLLFVKHWNKENLWSKCVILFRVLCQAIFSLMFEQFLIKEYKAVKAYRRLLTNVK